MQQLTLQQRYQITSNHSYAPYKEQGSKWFTLCVTIQGLITGLYIIIFTIPRDGVYCLEYW